MAKAHHKKLAIIVAWLVEEAKDVRDEVIEKEIFEESNPLGGQNREGNGFGERYAR